MSAPDRFDEATFRRKLLTVPSVIVEKALLLYAILTDRGTPKWVRALVLAALVYLINPFDAIPDALPGIGYIDDLGLIVITLERLSHYVTPHVKERAQQLTPSYFKASSGEVADPQTESDAQPIADSQSYKDNPTTTNNV